MTNNKKVIAFEDPEYGIMYIEVEKNPESKFGDASGGETEIPDRIEGKLSQVLATLKNFGKGVMDTVSELEPSEVEIKTGLKLEVQEGKLIGFFAQAKAEFPFEITLKWKKNDQKMPSEE